MQNRILKTELVDWKQILPLQPENAKININHDFLRESLLKYGFSMPFYGWEYKGKIYAIDGHTRKAVLLEMDNVPDKLPCTFISAKNRSEAIKILIEVFNQKSNRFDGQVLIEMLEMEEINPEELNLESVHVEQLNDKDPKEPKMAFFVPDCLYPANNIYDIPTLKLELQGDYPQLPIKPYGADSRNKSEVGTYHFYVDDYRFEAIWDDPTKILKSGCTSIFEPNLSLYDTTPISYGMYLIYKKRWISRFFQENGIKVFADLNVSKKFYEYNILGIPDGYSAFSTRGYLGKLGYLEEEYSIAKQICGNNELKFIVYGGGKDVKKFCADHNLIYVQDFMNDKRGEHG